MARTRGEGRAQNEKSQRVIEPLAVRHERKRRLLLEEAEWQAQNGPVETRRISDA